MKLELYTTNMCPYCFKVIKFMRKNNIKIRIKNISKPRSGYKEELIKLGGKKQLPALSMDGKILYESEDIIKWLKENYRRSQNDNS